MLCVESLPADSSMNSLAFVTHPSVRIKGSENNYTPSLCLDERCPIKAPHMHCPFCVKTDAYQDPVILKAHYRVKHVDKGIEFAGLKILRCCDHCDIVGIIKGEKRFKGAHWHCYRCRNGFNRRDEAIKHYKTHFRNPQTTFQIQITQDLNLPPGGKTGNEQHHEVISQQRSFTSGIENPIHDIDMHSALAQAPLSDPNVINTDGNVAGDKYKKVKVKDEPLLQRSDNHSGVAVDQGQTIMIIQGDNLESAFADHIISGREVSVLDKNSVDPSLSWEIKYRMEEDEKNEYKARMEEYKNQVEVLQQRIQELESQHPTSQLRVQDLLASLSLGDESKQHLAQQISKYLEELQSQEEPDADLVGDQHVESQHQSLISSDGIINQLTNSSCGQADDGELATDAPTSLEHSDLQSDSTVVAQLGHITGPYQVIDSTNHNHHHNSEENPIPDSIDNNATGSISVGGNSTPHDPDNIYSSSVTNISIEEGREVKDDMFQPVSSSGSHTGHEIIVAQVMSSDNDQSNIISQKLFVDSGDISDACNNRRIINIDGTVDNDRLLQVVAASAQGNHGSGTFIMETENGQQIIIQRAEEPTDSGQGLTHHKLEPDPKRPRFLEEA